MQTPYWVYGGAQDTHSWAGPSATPKRIGIVNGDWVQTNFGDGMVQAPDPNDPGTFYNESQGGNISRVDLVTGDRRAIRPVPPNPPAAPDGAEAGDEAEALSTDLYRFNWMSPIVISPHDSARVYLGGNRLFISDERGESWTPTRDLTRGEDRSELEIMGTVPDENTLSRNDGTSQWGTITTISESTREPGVIWAGTDDGLVQLSRDGGDTWTRIGTGNVAGGDTTTFAGLDPFRTLVTRVVASHHATGRAYVTFDRHRLDDFAPYVFVTEDFGASWRPLSTGFPSDEVIGWVNAFAEHPKSPNLLRAGTETGLFVSTDRGTSWSRMRGASHAEGAVSNPVGESFPVVPVDDLVIHPRDNDLVVGTHGRSIWILDDLAPLVELANASSVRAAQLFAPRPATQYLPWKHESYGGQRQYAGANPPYGASITYWLEPPAAAELDDGAATTLTIVDSSGAEVRNLLGSANGGMNRVVWDLRAAAPESLENARGPLVPPDSYTVRFEREGTTLEVALEVRVDDRVRDLTVDDHRARYEFLSDVLERRATIAEAIDRLRSLEDQIEVFREGREAGEASEDEADELPESITTAIDVVAEEIVAIRQGLRGPAGFNPTNRAPQRLLGRLWGDLDGDAVRQATFSPPTQDQRRLLATAERLLDEQLDAFNSLVADRIPTLNRQIGEAGLAWLRPGQTLARE